MSSRPWQLLCAYIDRCVAPRTEPREGAAVTEVIHDAAVWVHDYTRTAQAISPSQARSQPSDDGGRFLHILELFQSLKIGVPHGYL